MSVYNRASSEEGYDSSNIDQDALLAGVLAAEDAAKKTKRVKYPDPGSHAIGIIFRAIYETAKIETQPKVHF